VRHRIGFWAAAAVLCVLSPVAVRAATPSGTQISAAAEAQYRSDSQTVMPKATSNTITITVSYPAGISIGDAKTLPDGQFLELAPNVVTAGTAQMGGVFYIEAYDRSAGIRVSTDRTVDERDEVTVWGILATIGGERQVTASEIVLNSVGNLLPEPLGLAPTSFGSGIDSAGLLLKLWGRLTQPGSGYFYLDGSALTHSASATILVHGVPPADSLDKFVSVTGICGVEIPSTQPVPVIRTRGPSDIILMGP